MSNRPEAVLYIETTKDIKQQAQIAAHIKRQSLTKFVEDQLAQVCPAIIAASNSAQPKA